MKNKNAKLIYAQSSDIKARTYIEYRKDMKKKAIAELEILPWLNNNAVKERMFNKFLKNEIERLKDTLNIAKKKSDLDNNKMLSEWIDAYKKDKNIKRFTKNKFSEFKNWAEETLMKCLEDVSNNNYNKITIRKYGGDKSIWFLREGGITREPDYVILILIEKEKELYLPLYYIEFQYADAENLDFYDFKVSKVTKKKDPHQDRIFLYVVKNSYRYAFIDPKWIMEHGEIGVVPAWGSRQAYRIPKDIFEKILERDETLKPVVKMIDAKINILNFQHQLLEFWENELSNELQKVIDEEKLVKIIPKTLGGFFKVCFILDHLNKIPENTNLWLVYLLSYLNTELTLKEISMLVYSLDYIYSKITALGDNELRELEDKIKILLQTIDGYYDEKEGLYKSTVKESPLEETRFALFSVNLIEDIIQDAIVYHKARFQPIVKIYQHVRDILKVSETLRNI